MLRVYFAHARLLYDVQRAACAIKSNRRAWGRILCQERRWRWCVFCCFAASESYKMQRVEGAMILVISLALHGPEQVPAFEKQLPSYYCHGHFTSFVRQLNNYGGWKRACSFPVLSPQKGREANDLRFPGFMSLVQCSLTEPLPGAIFRTCYRRLSPWK